MPLIQALTLEGFAVFVPNVRGSTGYGMDYMKRVDHDWGGQDRLDHVHALTEVLPNDERVDASRAGVVGRSYGGYMTLTLAGRHPELWSAAIDMFGPYDMFTFLDRIPPTWKPYFELAIGHPERDRDFLTERSPKTHMDNLACPMLVIQGKNDPRVVEQESSDLVEAMRAQGKDVDYLVFEDEGHDVLETAEQGALLRDHRRLLQEAPVSNLDCGTVRVVLPTARRSPAKQLVGDGAEDQSPQEELLPVLDVRDAFEKILTCSLPDERVGDDDRRCIRGRAPEERQVDDRGRKAFCEEHVAGEIRVNELARSIYGPKRAEEAREMFDLLKSVGRQFAPGNTVCNRPRMGAVDDELRSWRPGEGCVEPLADGDDALASICLRDGRRHAARRTSRPRRVRCSARAPGVTAESRAADQPA